RRALLPQLRNRFTSFYRFISCQLLHWIRPETRLFATGPFSVYSIGGAMKALWVLVCAFSLGHGGEMLNVETLPTLRTQQYSLSSYKKIVVFSAPRTGSSLVYNVFRYLFENQENLFHAHHAFNQSCLVLKTHKPSELGLIEESPVLFVIPIRNPVDAIISNFR